MMSNIYPLEWLDSLILQTLNPKRTEVMALSDDDLILISENVLKESQKIQGCLKSEIFSLRKKRQIRQQIRKYHTTLIFLLDNIIENQKCKELQIPSLSKIIDLIIRSLDELLSFVENRFSYYLSLDERVPVTYLMVSRKELQLKLNRLKTFKFNSNDDRITIKIVIDVLSQTIESKATTKVTFRQLLYEREFLKNLESKNYLKETSLVFSPLDEVLISMNFNNRDYIKSLTERFLDHLHSIELNDNKLSGLLLYYKDFNQLHCSEKFIFDVSLHNIRYVLDNWFKHEIDYLHNKMELSSNNNSQILRKMVNKNEIVPDKIECVLSTDQIGLILRAGDESRILKARSMSQVFKTIVPHLSTAQKKDLSYESMRSKSYTVEERDKEIAIKTLERIIKHIKEY